MTRVEAGPSPSATPACRQGRQGRERCRRRRKDGGRRQEPLPRRGPNREAAARAAAAQQAPTLRTQPRFLFVGGGPVPPVDDYYSGGRAFRRIAQEAGVAAPRGGNSPRQASTTTGEDKVTIEIRIAMDISVL